MKGLNRNEMNDTVDYYIRREIKDSAAQHQPPANGRARLLLVAASQQVQPVSKSRKRLQFLFERRGQPAVRTIDLYNINWLWAMHMSFTHLRHVA